MIGYPNGQDKPHDKCFIDQVCSVKMAGYWPRSFFASLWTETEHAKKEVGQYPAILTSHLVNNPYLFPYRKLHVLENIPIFSLFFSFSSLNLLTSNLKR